MSLGLADHGGFALGRQHGSRLSGASLPQFGEYLSPGDRDGAGGWEEAEHFRRDES